MTTNLTGDAAAGTPLARRQAFETLRTLAARPRVRFLEARFASEPDRFDRYCHEAGALTVDLSKQLIDEPVLQALQALAEEVRVDERRAAMFDGRPINVTEGRAVLHVALRDQLTRAYPVGGEDVMPAVRDVRMRMRRLCERVSLGAWTGHTGRRITDVVNIGIGGSDLGPRLVCRALRRFRHGQLRAHFVANIDGTELAAVLEDLEPETTLFLVASKTFTTQETLTNARSARQWLTARLGEEAVAAHFVALSTNAAEVEAFGIDPRNMFEFWDWVGGRYSLWSAIGMSIALYLGVDHFDALLDGAHEMDRHFESTGPSTNVPLLLALAGVWNRNCLGFATQAVVPYEDDLALLPAYLQQLEMESNGKSVTLDGDSVSAGTAPVLWGAQGTNAQHAFFQQIHQGPDPVPVDFIVAAREGSASQHMKEHHRLLFANCLAQSQALMRGRTLEEARAQLIAAGRSEADADRLAPHRVFDGDRPSTTILMDTLSPRSLGNLLALYEHKVFVQGVLWGINSFDQWGVELGKELASSLAPLLRPGADLDAVDASTAGLLRRFAALRRG